MLTKETVLSLNRAIPLYIVNVVKIVIGSAVMALSAQLCVYIGPIPVTGQTLGLALVGLFLDRRLAAWSLILYILEGLHGLPVFSGGRFGLIQLLGPTGGYLMGMVPAVYLISRTNTANVSPSLITCCISVFLGILVVHVFGLTQYTLIFGTSLSVSLYCVLLLGDLIKGLSAVTIWSLYRYINRK